MPTATENSAKTPTKPERKGRVCAYSPREQRPKDRNRRHEFVLTAPENSARINLNRSKRFMPIATENSAPKDRNRRKEFVLIAPENSTQKPKQKEGVSTDSPREQRPKHRTRMK